MSLLTVHDIYKKHGNTTVVDGVCFTQEQGKKIAIAGETGSGKTTLMRIVAGLGQADSGEVLFEDKKVKGIDEKLMAGHKGIAYLSQHFELNNNYRVEEVLDYANNLTTEESERLFSVCRINHLLKRTTQTLSGGEKQRVALAKLLTHAPRLLLLDEPFSNMDQIHKNILKAVIDDVGDRLGITCMLISHDPEDILPWADEVLVMQQGRVVQKAPPTDIYRNPENEYVAGLFGKYNILNAPLAAAFQLSAERSIFTRPEEMILVSKDEGIEGKITKVSYLGSHSEIEVEAMDQTLTIKTDKIDLQKGDIVYLQNRK